MDLEYGLNQKVPFLKSVLFGIQWAAILISILIILGKVIGSLHYSDQIGQVVYLQKLLFLSGITIFCQVLFGHKLPIVSGPSAVLLIGVIASRGFDISVIYTSVMVGGLLIFFLAISGLFLHFQRLFTSTVVAVVLLLLTFTLAPVIQNLMVDVKSGVTPLFNLGFSLILTFLMFFFYKLLRGILRATLIIWAMIAGSVVYYIIFPVNMAGIMTSDIPWLSGFFREMNFNLSIEPGVLISFIFCSIALSTNDLGSMQSVNELLNPDNRESRVTRGVALTGIANIVSGFFGVIGPVNYSLSPGLIISTRCASRFTILPAATILLIMAFLPAATAFIGGVPSVVIGSVLAYTMTSQVSAGLMVAFREGAFPEGGKKGFRYENGLVIGLSVLLGTVVAFLPAEVVNSMPAFLRPIIANGFVAGVISALFLEHVVFRKKHA